MRLVEEKHAIIFKTNQAYDFHLTDDKTGEKNPIWLIYADIYPA